MSRENTTRVYVGNLGDSGQKKEIEREFEKFGSIHDVWVARNPPGFAFVEFRDYRDAEDAVKEMDGKRLCGQYIKVQFSHGKGGGRGGGGGGGGRDRRGPPPRAPRQGGRYDDRGGYRGDRGHDRSGDRYDKFGDERSGGYDRYGSPPRRSPPRRGRSPVDGGNRSRSRSPRPARF